MIKNIIDDGLSIYFALQGQGKTFVCTHKAVMELLNPKSKRKVISNYPIIVTVQISGKQKLINRILKHYKTETRTFKILNKTITLTKQTEQVLSSYKWNDEYTNSSYHVQDALILIDEGHTRYTGSYAWELTKEDRKFFSTLRHNNIAAYIMTQRSDDIHPFLRGRTAFWNEISKVKHFWSKNPAHFYIDTYTSHKDYMNRVAHKLHKKAKPTRFRREKIPFTQLVGTAYNTHYYRNIGKEPEYVLWLDELNKDKQKIQIPEPTIEEYLDENIIKDSIGALVKMNKWKKRDATLEVNKILVDNDTKDVNTVEKIIRQALARRSKYLEEAAIRDEEQNNNGIEETN